MSEKKICIHIGGMKTGTTALQIFLAKNRKALEAQGFCYPGTGAAQWEICGDIDYPAPGKKPDRGAPAVRQYLAEIRKSACHTGILSGECLSFPGGDTELLRSLIPPALPVTIVYYARRQDFLIESFYHQTVKSRFRHITNRLDEDYVNEMYLKSLCDHPRVLIPWAESFGKENIIVRCYEKQQMKGDIIGDFAATIGLSLNDTFVYPKGRSNSQVDQPHSEFIRLCNSAFPDAAEISKFLFFHRCHRSRLFENRPKRSLLSPKTRIAILDHYEASNQAIARDYLGRVDGRLFYDSPPDPKERYDPYQGLTIDELSLIMNELIENTDLQNRDLEPLMSVLLRLNRAATTAGHILPEGAHRGIRKIADSFLKAG